MEKITRDQILDAIEDEIPRWLRRQGQPGIYRIWLQPDGGIETQETFSGDNSYLQYEERMIVLEADIREVISLADRGLDEDGDVIEVETVTRGVDEAEDKIDLVLEQGQFSFGAGVEW